MAASAGGGARDFSPASAVRSIVRRRVPAAPPHAFIVGTTPSARVCWIARAQMASPRAMYCGFPATGRAPAAVAATPPRAASASNIKTTERM